MTSPGSDGGVVTCGSEPAGELAAGGAALVGGAPEPAEVDVELEVWPTALAGRGAQGRDDPGVEAAAALRGELLRPNLDRLRYCLLYTSRCV